MYLYLGDKPSINGGLKYLKYCIKIEKRTINFLYTKRIYMYMLPFETVLGVWNFSVMLQNVCFDKLNVLCLCKIVYACDMFLYLYRPLLFLKDKQITKTNATSLCISYKSYRSSVELRLSLTDLESFYNCVSVILDFQSSVKSL
jgi:hypothetical protein